MFGRLVVDAPTQELVRRPKASLCNYNVCSSRRHNPFTETLDNWAFGSSGEAIGPRVLRCHHAARRINSSVLDFRLPPREFKQNRSYSRITREAHSLLLFMYAFQ
jgi:hypothetical protein